MASNPPITVVKNNGEKDLFSPEKLRNSLYRAGASPEVIDQIEKQVKGLLYDGITTRKIYREAFQMLKKHRTATAARYQLKKAIMALGPSGFLFEAYIGRYFEALGYDVKVGVTLTGACGITHEVDIFARKGNELLIGELKFGNSKDKRIDVKIPLYIHSRFRDLEAALNKDPALAPLKKQGWIITNTFFSRDAIRYGKCVGLQLQGWSYPQNRSFKDLIDSYHLYPVTTLTVLNNQEKKQLLSRKVMMVKDLLDHPEHLEALNLSPNRLQKIKTEVEELCLP